MRRIVHFDADAFYASVEQRDDVRLRGKPVAVGGTSQRGVVMAASYEARAFGVRSAMPVGEALRRCPALTVVPPRMETYRGASRAIFDIYRSYTDLVEPLALDEAYLDLSDPLRGAGTGSMLAATIRSEVLDRVELVVSAGVSFGKFFAKLASAEAKPNGIFELPGDAVRGYLAVLPVERIHGVGPRTAERLRAMGITTAGSLAAHDVAGITAVFGKLGRDVWHLAQGVDERPVRPDRERKSVSSETTFEEDRHGLMQLLAELPAVCASTSRRAERAGVYGTVVVVKVKTARHEVVTRQQRLMSPVRDAATIFRVASDLVATRVPLDGPVRLLGVGLAGLTDRPSAQGALFEEDEGAGGDARRERA